MDWPVRLAVRTHGFHPCNRVSTTLRATNASIAQLVEQLICNQQVVGSSPIRSSTNKERLYYGYK